MHGEKDDASVDPLGFQASQRVEPAQDRHGQVGDHDVGPELPNRLDQLTAVGDGAEIVGIVGNVRYGSPDLPVRPDVYLPLLQSVRATGVIFVRSRVPAASAVGMVRHDVKTLDPDLPLTDIRMMEERASEATSAQYRKSAPIPSTGSRS